MFVYEAIHRYICISQMSSGARGLPEGSVYLDEIDPTIQQYPLYYESTHSFVGRQIDGYKAPKIILTKKTALALKNVQKG